MCGGENAFAVASLLPLQGPKSFGGAKPQIVFPASGFFSSLGRRDVECVSFPPWHGAGAPGQGLPVQPWATAHTGCSRGTWSRMAREPPEQPFQRVVWQ